MRLTSIILTALAVAVCAPSVGSSQYAPEWHVGDWWVVKTLERSMSGDWVWDHMRYDVVGVEKVGNRDCFVLETRFQWSEGTLARTKNVFYVRTDDWLVVRQVMTTMYNDTLLPPVTSNCPLGLFGPFQGGEPRLPRFPLQLGNNTDTMFRLQKRDDCSAFLREMSGVADSTLVNRLLNEGDTVGGRVVRPTGAMFQVRSEMGGNLEPGPLPGESRITQSFQLWCEDQPWRLYEEYVQYNGVKRVRLVVERTWLIASGHAGR